MVLDAEKRGLRTFSQWYHNNNDTMDFLPHNNNHREASTLLLSFISLHQKKADEYNLQVKRFANRA
jgi:hypothetical protein